MQRGFSPLPATQSQEGEGPGVRGIVRASQAPSPLVIFTPGGDFILVTRHTLYQPGIAATSVVLPLSLAV